MRLRSTTNSHKHVNDPLRNEYSDTHGLDEIAFELGICLKDNLGFTPTFRGMEVKGTETNHIFTNPRWDLWSNLIRLSAPAHRWFHRNLDAGRALCLCAKARKAARTGYPRDFDFEELMICRKHIVGWLEAVELPPFVNCFRDETLCRLFAADAKGSGT